MIDLLQQSRESEETVLGYCIYNIVAGNRDNARTVFAELTPNDFLNPKLKSLYDVCTQFVDKPVTFTELCNATGFENEFVKGIVGKHSDFIKIDPYINHVKQMSKRYDIAKIANSTYNDILANGDINEIVDKVSGFLSEVEFGDASDERDTKEVVDEIMEEIVKAKSEGYNPDKYISLGLEKLDEVVGGLEAGWLVLVGARPGMGKTQLSLVMAENVAKMGKAVTFFSLEMSKEELLRRLILKNTKITATDAKYGRYTDEQLTKAHKNASDLYGIPLLIDDNGGISTAYIDNVIRKHVIQHDTKLVIIDYIQLIGGKNGESTYERATRVANELKSIAKKHGVAIIALSQLNRLNEQRKDKRPNMAELRDSGSLEQNADLIMLLYRDSYYTESATNLKLEVNVAKHRHGRAATVSLYYNPSWGTIK